jgi:two-component system, NtrC family, sensor kinase
VLKVISRSTFDLQTVLDTLVESAARLCMADRSGILLPQGDVYRQRANYRFAREGVEYALAHPLQVDRGSITGRVVLEGRQIHIHDVLADPEYRATDYQQAFGFRTCLGVPLLREGTTIGVFVLNRDEVNPFTDKQIELVTTFADQAVIAVENVRLFEAEQQRTRELTESREQQTATSEVLRVISSSPGDPEPVFQTMLENATRICEAKFGTMYFREGDAFRAVAMHGAPPSYRASRLHALVHPGPNTGLSRSVQTRDVVQIEDIAADQGYSERDPMRVGAVELGGVRTLLSVPMLKEREVIGVITIYREVVRPFTDKQINLVRNFAAQAIIAIENTRLLNELRQRTTDLSESLDQQTATSKVLEVISRSAFDLQAVFETVAESSVRLCGADRAFIFRFDGELLRMTVAFNTVSQEWKEYLAQHPSRPGRDSAAGRAALERRTVHIPDVQADHEYTFGAKNIEKVRTVLAVPILKGEDLLGVVGIYHLEVRPFTEKQIALVETFAD